MPYGNYDQNIQPIKLSNENTIRHQALILLNNKTNLPNSKSNEFCIIPRNMPRKDTRDHKAIRKRRDSDSKIK